MTMRSLAFLLIAGFVLVMAGGADAEYVNPELELKFNLKEENDTLSPQNKLPGEPEATKTVQADYDDHGIMKTNRQPVHVGTWTSDPVEFDVSLYINSFDIWWESIEESDDSCEWTITILHNGEERSEDTSGCQHDGEELEKGSHNLDTSIDLVAGDTIGIDLVFEGWNDIRIHYDNVTYDTGLNVNGKLLIFFGVPPGTWENTTVSMEFAEAWPTNWNTNLDAEYVIITGDDGYIANNAKANVSDGNKHTFQRNNRTMEVNSTMIEWVEINGTGLRIMMDYTTFDHMPGNGSSNGTDYRNARVVIALEKKEPKVKEPGNNAENEKKEDEEEKCVDGDTKIAEDGCNQCICSNEEWACTEVDCNPDDNAVKADDESNISVPSISLISSIVAIGIIALRRRY